MIDKILDAIPLINSAEFKADFAKELNELSSKISTDDYMILGFVAVLFMFAIVVCALRKRGNYDD